MVASNDESLGSLEPSEIDNEVIKATLTAVNTVEGPSSSGYDMAVKGFESARTIPLRLSQLQLELQLQLQRLAALSIPSRNVEFHSPCGSDRENHTLSEALMGAETLMLIIEALRESQGQHETGHSRQSPIKSSQISNGVDWSPCSNSLHETGYITVLLQVLMCYMQLLQIYNHLLTLIKCDLQQSGTSVASVQSNNTGTHGLPATFLSNTVFTFGQFNLASHVHLKARVTVQLLSSMLRRIQGSLDTVMSDTPLDSLNNLQSANRTEFISGRKQQELPGVETTHTSSPMLLAAKAAVSHLHLEERKVLDRLEEIEREY